MKRVSVALVLVLGLLAAGPLGPEPSVAVAAARAPKVVLIVGPAGAATERYRRLADEAAAEAARYTDHVIRVYSPDATWPAVKRALEGASVVVYLGHGNGWPSRYRNVLTPSTQNGFGLNPHAGSDNHQYFGEGRVGSEVKLAKNAVVVFSHLCYASGNTEPGLPEGTLEQAQQRVDNYAAGFIRAGAAAVIAEAHMGPAWYVRSILAGKATIDRIWRDAPTQHGNLLRFDSLRSPGYVAQMDPDRAASGFHRSIVLREGLAAANVLAGAVGGRSLPVAPLEPTLAGLGVRFGAPDLAAPPTAAAATSLTFGVDAADPSVLPAKLMVGVRWDALPGAATGLGGGPGGSPPPTSSPGASPAPSVEPAPVDLVQPESPGKVVAPVAAERSGNTIAVPVQVPGEPGLYRLVATIHGPDGVAYDAATQALVPALVVRVSGPLAAAYTVPAAIFATAGEAFELRVDVTNIGATSWAEAAVGHRLGPGESEPVRRATLVARWVDLDGGAGTAIAARSTAVLPGAFAPGASATAFLRLTAPAASGEYLLLVDVLSARSGSLAAAGVPPALVRVTVSGAAAAILP